jgi:hypothetical protein
MFFGDTVLCVFVSLIIEYLSANRIRVVDRVSRSQAVNNIVQWFSNCVPPPPGGGGGCLYEGHVLNEA